MNTLIVAVGRKTDSTELTDDDVAHISDAERDEFAEKILETNQYLFREQVREVRRDQENHAVVSIRDGDIKHEQAENESNADYLFRLFQIQQAELQDQARRIMAPFENALRTNKRLFTPSFLEAEKSVCDHAAWKND